MSREFPQAKCKSCRAPIHWTWTEGGAKAPMDAEPTASGTFAIGWATDRPGLKSWFVPPNQRDGSKLYTAHFGTCPNADEHRR